MTDPVTPFQNRVQNNLQSTIASLIPANGPDDDIQKGLEKQRLNEFTIKVLDTIIYPRIEGEISNIFLAQKIWDFLATIFITLKYLTHFAAIIYSFLALTPILNNNTMSMATVGILNTSSIIFEQMGKYFTANSENRLMAKNKLFQSLGITYRQPDTNFKDPSLQILSSSVSQQISASGGGNGSSNTNGSNCNGVTVNVPMGD